MHLSTRRFTGTAPAAVGSAALVVIVACTAPQSGLIPGDGVGDDGTGPGSDAGGQSSGADGGSRPGSDATSASHDGSPAGDSTSSSPPPPPSRGPTPATATVAFPFPQNRQAAGSIYPAGYLNSDVQTAYARWTNDLVTTTNAGGHRRVQRTSSDGVDTCRPLGSTVSEGIGYGMLIAVYMNDQGLFDDLWLYEQQNLDQFGLMNWAPNGPTDVTDGCTGGATDADEDMAFALVMADRQWGGQGSLSQTYLAAAQAQMKNIWYNEIYSYLWIRAGDGMWATNANQNISYYAPAYYRVFAKVDPAACAPGVSAASANPPCDGWLGAINQSYATISDALSSANGNQANGLVPGWCDDSHGAPCSASGSQPFNFQYDACRTPFRIGLDASWNSYAAAKAYVASTSAFFSGIGASHIVDGYALNGSPQAANPGKLSAAFIGPATVGAMTFAADQQFVNDGYAAIATDTAFAGGEYYESSWTVMSLLMLTGNFLDYTQETPTK
jgi:endo-1,4-beta-D-glucanase Y